MIRRLVLAAAAVLLAAGCHGTQQHWPRTSSQAVVHVESDPGRVGSLVHDAVVRAAAEWSKSSRIEMYVVESAPAWANTVEVRRGDQYDAEGWTLIGADPDGHLHTVRVYFRANDAGWCWCDLSLTTQRFVVVHEMGHAVGLGHDSNGNTSEPGDPSTGRPTAHDYDELLKMYDHLDS